MEGVSTRRVDDLVKALGCEGISKSQVSRICQGLDEVVEKFLNRPLDGGPYAYLWLDALTQKVREEGRIVNVSVAVELVSIVVEIASRWSSSSSGDGLLGAHRQLGQDTVLELRSIHQQAHKIPSSVQRTPALTQPQRHLEHKV